MAVISVEPIASRASSIDSSFVRTYTLVYRVVTSDRLDGPYVARTAVPWGVGDQYNFGAEYDTGAYCTDVSASEDSGGEGISWLVTVSFGRLPPTDENPLLQPYKYSYNGQPVDEPYNIDVTGKAVCNTVGDPFQNQLVRQISRPILSVTRNEATFNPLIPLLSNTVNADVFFGNAPGTALCMPPQVSTEYHQTYGYYYVTSYEFAINPDGWDDYVWNLGTRSRNPRGVLKPIVLNGTPVTDPVPLTWSGDVLPQNAAPITLRFQPYNKMPFSILGLN